MAWVEQFVQYLRSAYAPASVSVSRLGKHLSVLVGDAQLDAALARPGRGPAFEGWSPAGERIAIFDHNAQDLTRPAPASFRVAAVVPVFNEVDVIEHTLEYLTRDGIGVYVIDNWSTDGTADIARRYTNHGLLGLERFPPHAPPSTYDLRAILARVEDVARRLDADWVILHDADERRRAPWPGISLRDALFHVDGTGFTCIDHVTLNFWPIDDGYDASIDVEEYFAYFEFSNHPGHFHQRRAWKNLPDGVSLAASAGHDAGFSGRRVYPYKFLLKHYPVRSQAHAERKVLRERRERWNAAERALGWHQQYDAVSRFLRDPSSLERFDPGTFYARRLIERLSGVGIFQRPPEWATPPKWAA